MSNSTSVISQTTPENDNGLVNYSEIQQARDYQKNNVRRSQASAQCVVVGHSIDAMTTATVLASMGNQVTLYTDEKGLAYTLTTYTFEHQLQALWELYISERNIEISMIDDHALTLFNSHANPQTVSLYWLFYTDLPESWRTQMDGQDVWVGHLNESRIATQTPIILSGTSKLGVFTNIAKQCNRPWLYYVPFVFLQDGQAYSSMLSPSLWLMGEKTPGSSDKVAPLQPLIKQAQQSFVTDIATIEFSRSTIMSMLATRVSFMNEWTRLADKLNVDITEVATIMGLDARIGQSYLQAGWGFGGKALPAELKALQDTQAELKVTHRLMQAVDDINEDQKELIFRKFWQYFDGAIENKTIGIWGASYKSGSGRTSGAAIHPLLNLLWSYDIVTYVYAAEAEAELASLYPDQPLLHFVESPTTPLATVSALFILAWPTSIERLPLAAINDVAVPIFDAANIFERSQIQALVGDYIGMGRGN